MEAVHRELLEADQRANEALTPEGHLALAAVYTRHGRLDKSLTQYQRAQAQDGEGRLAQQILSGMAAVHHQQGEFAAAIESHTQVLQLCGEANARLSASCLEEIGLSYYKMGEYSLALESFQRTVEVLCRRAEAQEHPGLVAGHMGMAGSLFRQQLYAPAGECAGRALVAAEDHRNETEALEAQLALGNVHFCLQNPAEALSHYQRALDAAERQGDPRNQCRALCGAGLCYYASGEVRGAAKLFQTALARDELVPASGAAKPPTTGEQLVDEQFLLLLHWTLRNHATQDLMGTIYLGLTAVMMNGGGVLTPVGLPQGLVETVVQSLQISAEGESMSAARARYAPHLLHYAIHILQQCVRQKTLRHLVSTQAVADGLLACLAFLTDQAAGGMQCHTAAYKTLKALINCPGAAVTREEVCDLFLRSPKLPTILDLLPRRAKPANDARHRQVADILSTLLTVLSSTGSRGSGAGRLSSSSDIGPIASAVCGATKLLLGGEAFAEADLQLLELGLRLLLLLWKRIPGLKGLITRRLNPAELDAFGRAAVPPASPAVHLSADLHRLMKDHVEVRAAAGLVLRPDDPLSTSGEGEDLSILDTTTFGSVSSEASFMYSGLRPAAASRRLSLLSASATEDVDTDDLTVVESWADEPNTS
eukprot:GGOE01022376.1.p1 GENE.GGOE01022376.1~~GGOE01022376.1.p1  ORF type:complete len:651 (-),score=217.76 GGOE01022376.1:737-2689(-)